MSLAEAYCYTLPHDEHYFGVGNAEILYFYTCSGGALPASWSFFASK